jgi:hypothetical protein
MELTMQIVDRDMAALLTEIQWEVERAKKHGEKFASLHEAYAVILEELDEVWDLTRMKRRDRDPKEIRKEMIQIAAMAVKSIQSIDNFTGGTV